MRKTRGCMCVAPLAKALLIAAASLSSAGVLPSQEPVEPLDRCDGRPVSEVVILTEPAPAIVRGFASAVLRYETTREEVVRAFLQLSEGDICTEQRRAESARLLRRQRFIARARVQAVPDTGGTVRIEVETFDELPVVIGADLGGGISGVTFGTSNLDGRGLLAAVSWDQADAYRDGLGVRIDHAAFLARPWRLLAEVEREPLGHDITLSFSREFLTTLQRLAWHVGLNDERSYEPMRRLDDEFPVAVIMERTFWDAGAVMRVGGRALGLFAGTLLTRERVDFDEAPVIVTDTGLAPIDPEMIGDGYAPFSNTRIAGIIGLRALTFVPAVGVTTLASEQDLPAGVQLAVQLGRSVPWFEATDRDQFVASDLYIGRGSASAFVALGGRFEARRDLAAEHWDGIIASGRLGWFWKPTERRTWEVSAEMSGGWRERLPMQLTLGDRTGGLRGFRGTRAGGARRAVMRVERRQTVGELAGGRAAWGYALFGDAGKLWSGNVPFGVTTGVRGSVGLSILAAAPVESRRVVRLDVAVPVTTGAIDSWQVRLLTVNTVGRFWREPSDVFRARTGASPATIFEWP